MILYSAPLSMFGAKVEIAVLEKKTPCTVVMAPFSLAQRYEPKHDDVVRINPKRQVPVLIDGAVEIYDSTQIFEYLEDKYPSPNLWPQARDGRALARRLELEADEIFFPHVAKLVTLQRDLRGREAQDVVAALNQLYESADRRLGDRDYLADTFSFADIAFFMAQFFAAFLGAEMNPDLSHLRRWRARMLQRPAVIQVIAPMCRYLAQNNLRVPKPESAAA